MSVFHEVIVSYDVVDTKVRGKLYNTLKDFGLMPIQKSVMWGYVNYAEERSIFTYLQQVLNKEEDKGFVLRVGDASSQMIERGVGYKDTPFHTVYTHEII